MPRKTRLFNWGDKLIAAFSLSGAKRLVRERYGSISGNKLFPVTGRVKYFDQEGEPLGRVNGRDCSGVWPMPMIVPDAFN